MSDDDTTYVTAVTAATRAGEWLKKAETTYKGRLAVGADADAALEVSFGQAWAALARVLL